MDYPTIRLQAIKDEFARRRRRVIIAEVAVMALLVLRVSVFRHAFTLPAGLWILFMFALVSASAWYAQKVWRCPNCGKSPGYSFTPTKCEQCGIDLSR